MKTCLWNGGIGDEEPDFLKNEEAEEYNAEYNLMWDVLNIFKVSHTVFYCCRNFSENAVRLTPL